ncbi:fucose 4-O-acetylase-like acetyltransferase [Pseudoclavibacter sp. JAI123]|uniref:acyltransferase family protein n=1 Tax=Pseudoclavibacter sp. JAI123 TaxID=2723065 RepID=UPI0015CD5FC9|nr:acyltransferase [Pseudoclavibacter sp. JAI123]NYF12753.1 fucose 4-O-acetylase-like acetyltransferase [Pseudoclavibacter sp. JAI123]
MTPTIEPSRAGRDLTIDVARGLAIIAIVAGHVLRGLSAADLVDGRSAGYVATDTLLYTFHLAVFAWLAGLFVRRGVERRGLRDYLWDRNATFIYLYVLWSFVQGGVKVLTSSLVNTPITVLDIFDLVHPEGHLWFLPWLVIVTTIVAIAKPWSSLMRGVLTFLTSLIMSLVAWGYSGGVIGPEGASLWVFFTLGAWIGDSKFREVTSRFSWRVSAVMLLVALAFFLVGFSVLSITPPTFGFEMRTPLSVGLGFLLSTIGVTCVLALARIISMFPVATRLFGYVGSRSLQIYLAHGIALSGARIVLSLCGVQSLEAHLIVGFGAGLGFPLLLAWLASRLRIRVLFEPPAFLLPSGQRASERKSLTRS